MASVAVRSKSVILLLFIYCLFFLPFCVGFCGGSLFCSIVLSVVSSDVVC